MAVSDVVRLLSTLLLAVMGPHAGLVLLMVIAFALGVGGAMFQPAEQALLPSLVPDEDLQAANGLNSVTNRFALIIGPPLSVFLVARFGPGLAFGVVLGNDLWPSRDRQIWPNCRHLQSSEEGRKVQLKAP